MPSAITSVRSTVCERRSVVCNRTVVERENCNFTLEQLACHFPMVGSFFVVVAISSQDGREGR